VTLSRMRASALLPVYTGGALASSLNHMHIQA
jgi:hypothetical protein